MGRDKALLPLGEDPLAGLIAAEVAASAGTATLIGDPERYQHLGFPVVGDMAPRSGPLGGLFTALTVTDGEWNLVVACDMPAIRRTHLEWLLRLARGAPAGCVVPRTPDGRVHPLCAVYSSRCLPAVTRALDHKRLKMSEIILELEPLFAAPIDPSPLANVNTPQDWTRYTDAR